MSSSILQIEVARVFKPLLDPNARYLGAHGGRGGGKSRFFSGRAVKRSVRQGALRMVCLREVQKDLKDSAKLLIEDEITRRQVPGFTIRKDDIVTPHGGIIIFKGMRDYTKESIKSLESFDVAWIEEAHTFSDASFDMLRPTLFRKPGCQIWASWNRTRKSDAIDAFFAEATAPDIISVKANYYDNPWFPPDLEKERRMDEPQPHYRHKWLGEYATVVKGAYYAEQLGKALDGGRIARVARDPIQTIRVFCDLGGSGAQADAFTMWVAQFLGREIRVLDYYEAVGQSADVHFNWLRDNDYSNAHIWLPHDGTQNHGPVNTTWQGAFKDAGFSHVNVVPNQGRGAAGQRIEAGRRLFPMMWFNQSTTEPGREALGSYHEKRDADRDIGLGPEHDWASHGADAFGLMCVVYEPPRTTAAPEEPREVYVTETSNAWMG